MKTNYCSNVKQQQGESQQQNGRTSPTSPTEIDSQMRTLGDCRSTANHNYKLQSAWYRGHPWPLASATKTVPLPLRTMSPTQSSTSHSHKALKPKVGNPAPGDWSPTQGMVFAYEQRLPRCVLGRGPVAKAFLTTGVWKSAWKPEHLKGCSLSEELQVSPPRPKQRSPLVYTLHPRVTLWFQTVKKAINKKKCGVKGTSRCWHRSRLVRL